MCRKIGVLTLQGSFNCGSMLQTYALQTILMENTNCMVEIIDFTNCIQRELYSIPKRELHIGIRPLLYNIRRKRMIPSIKKQMSDYEYFKKNHFNLSKNVFLSSSELKEDLLQYDIYICGSDQIWNVNMDDFDWAYFLGWVKNGKKIAYAPSLGGYDLTQFNINLLQVKNWLNEFSFLSVREDTGKKYLEKIINQDVPIVLDPTLLLTKEKWEELVDVPLIDEEYIFYYSYGYYSDDMNSIVARYAKEKRMNVYVINASKWITRSAKKYDFILAEEGGPMAFLNLVKNASITFVESYHGVIFSYIFEKNFWYLNATDDEMDSRVSYLLKQIHLEERVLSRKSIKNINIDSPIIYEKCQIDKLKEESLRLLMEAIS